MESEESCGSGDGQKKGGSGEEKWRAERERQERETEELEEKFRMFDTDGDGRITSAELGETRRRLFPPGENSHHHHTLKRQVIIDHSDLLHCGEKK